MSANFALYQGWYLSDDGRLCPMCSVEWGEYQDSITRIVLAAPGPRERGRKIEAPGAPLSTGAVSLVLPSFTVFQAMVKGSHHPPRNQQWSTIVAGSSVKMAKLESFP